MMHQQCLAMLLNVSATHGSPAIVRAGDAIVMSSRLWHRSGPNNTAQWRRAYMTQYRYRTRG
jgi:ectoine hydroxylase-related dioxygenase (phytanoyl-CoA dioxygenase family)